MRKIRTAGCWKNAQYWPDEKDRKELNDLLLLMTERGPASWEDLQDVMTKLEVLLAKMSGCRCTDAIVEQCQAIVQILKDMTGGDFEAIDLGDMRKNPQEIQDVYWKRCRTLAIRFARQGRCRMLRHALVCHCDEHDHPEK